MHGEEQADLSAWKAAPKKSLCSGFNDADPDAIIAWNRRMADLVAMDEIAKAIRNKVPAAKLRKMKSLTKIQKEWLERRIKKADFSEKMRLHYYLGVILDDEDEVQECFRTIQSEVLASTIKNLSYNENARIVTEKHTVKLPLRVNWGGGWSDTPPYCNENGGTVLNVAILLNGQKPVEVTLEKISEKKIVFDSRDMDVHGEFDTIEPLQATGDAGSSNTLIEQIFSSIEELIDGKLVCGAGGGGFLQVILKKGVTRQQVEERLNEVFMGESIEILEETLWNTIKVFSGYFFETSEGERFCYSVSGDEILISKSKESITRVDVNLAVEEILELNGVVESLQNMKVPGAGYLYPVFLRFGLIRRKGESDGHLSDMDNIQ